MDKKVLVDKANVFAHLILWISSGLSTRAVLQKIGLPKPAVNFLGNACQTDRHPLASFSGIDDFEIVGVADFFRGSSGPQAGFRFSTLFMVYLKE